jgi:glycosyltransferase involved in cell wall biosynthesis
MRILILSQWYMPEPALLLQELAQTLLARGHKVTVLTGFPNYPSGNLYPGYKLRLCQREILSGVPVVRVPLYPNHSHSGILRVINYFSFALFAALLGAWVVEKPDVIFVFHPPLTIGIPAYILSRIWRIPFVYQIQDMWPETLSATGAINASWVLKCVGNFACWLYSRASAICVISPGFRQNLLEKGVPEKRIYLTPNWIDPDTYPVLKPDSELARQLGLADRFNIMFAGNLGEAQGLETVLEAGRFLRSIKEMQFIFVGSGVAEPRLRKFAEEQDLTNVVFLGRYPAEQMPALYALADVLLIHLKDDPLFRITIPSKTYAYLATGKPILAAVSGDAAKVIVEAGAGVACAPQNSVELASALRELFSLHPSALHEMGRRGRAAAQTIHSREVGVTNIEAVLMKVLQGM